jgi:DnaK suppressor protein
MSKSTARSAPPPKKAVKKPAVTVRKSAGKAPAKAPKKAPKKAAQKPVSKVAVKRPAKPAPKKPVAKKAGAKPTGKPSVKAKATPAAKPTAKRPPKPAAKSAPKARPAVAAKPAATPPAKAAPKAAVAESKTRSMPSPSAKPVVAPAPVKPMSQARTAAAAGKAAAAAAAATAAAAASAAAASAASASRFADRFAPPKPVARTVADHSLDVLKPTVKADPKLAGAWKHKSGRDLTEAELLAMPEREYMNEKQLDYFRACLGALKDDLLSNAGETTEHLREDTTIVPDPADRATIEEEHALELRTRDRERKLLKKISQSLDRIEAGEYGYCDETGEPIGLGRLLARPTATLSLEAQQRREMKQKMFGD